MGLCLENACLINNLTSSLRTLNFLEKLVLNCSNQYFQEIKELHGLFHTISGLVPLKELTITSKRYIKASENYLIHLCRSISEFRQLKCLKFHLIYTLDILRELLKSLLALPQLENLDLAYNTCANDYFILNESPYMFIGRELSKLKRLSELRLKLSIIFSDELNDEYLLPWIRYIAQIKMLERL